jgi:hypothetical protein
MLRVACPGESVVGVIVASVRGSNPPEYLLVTSSDDPLGHQSIALDAGREFELMPEMRPNVASAVHCVGPSGVGKSTLAGTYGAAFKKFTGGRVIVVSASEQDDEALPCDARVLIDESIDGVSPEELAGEDRKPTLLIFDDVEALPRPAQKAFHVFQQAVLERGRKLGIKSWSIFHKGANSNSTKYSLNEATQFVVFPDALTANSTYMLRQYAGVDPAILNLVKRGRWGRWLAVLPGKCLISPHRAAVLDQGVLASIAKAERRRLQQMADAAVSGQHRDGAASLALQQAFGKVNLSEDQ